MEILYISLLFLFASFIGTVFGFGTSTISIPILAMFLPIQETVLLVAIIHWWGDIWKLLLFREGIRWWLILAFGLPGVIASYVGATLTFTI